jgi:hypothetical protein
MLRLLSVILCLLCAGCASKPLPKTYGKGQNQGYFLGQATITSNVPNLCAATNNKYAFKAQQYWLAGGTGAQWYGCIPEHTTNLQPEYAVEYSIVKNDGVDNNVITTCKPVYKGHDASTHFTNMDIEVQLGNELTCQVILS